MSSSSHENKSCQSASSHVNESCQSAYSHLQCRVLVSRVKNCVFCTRQSAVIERYAARVTQRSVTVRVIAQRKLVSRTLFRDRASRLLSEIYQLSFTLGEFKILHDLHIDKSGTGWAQGTGHDEFVMVGQCGWRED